VGVHGALVQCIPFGKDPAMGFNKRKMKAQRTAAAEAKAAVRRCDRSVDRHPFAALTSLIPALSCRSYRPHAPFAELVRLSEIVRPNS
jgi:hypothetical protein